MPDNKKSKKAKTQTNDNDDSDENADDYMLHEPSASEVAQAMAPENQLDIETIRQKKKAKHQTNVEVNKLDSRQRERQRNSEYLHKWKHARIEWKFEKLRQISIQNNLFKDEEVGDNAAAASDDDVTWAITVEYLAGTQGAARAKIVQKAEEIINDIDGRINEFNKNELVKLKNYNRAREILQLLQ